MALKDELISVVMAKGWLAIETIYMDNAMIFKTAMSNGFCCLNKTTGVFYCMSYNDSALYEKLNSTFLNDINNIVSYYANITAVDIDCIQRVQYGLYLTELEILKMVDKPGGTGSIMVPLIPNQIFTIPENPTTKAHEEFDIYTGEGTEMRPTFIKVSTNTFINHNNKFKAFIKNLTGCQESDLI